MKTSHPFHIHVPTSPINLWDKLRRLASINRRPLKEEALIAIEAHLKQNGQLSQKEARQLQNDRSQG